MWSEDREEVKLVRMYGFEIMRLEGGERMLIVFIEVINKGGFV